jgi:UDP-N-acetylmuramoyl-L-alanyl-D-glutamate--2,6-diaminopimelate ligase
LRTWTDPADPCHKTCDANLGHAGEMASVMAKLTTLCEAAGLAAPAHDAVIAGLTADSREVGPQFLFAALPGSKLDGARFVPSAVEKGAAAVLAHTNAAIETPANLAVLRSDDPRRALALMAAAFYGRQPGTIAAVTGTNGKTSIVSFVRQLWAGLGQRAASLGTIGLVTPDGALASTHTTPEPVALHRLLAEVAGHGVTHLAIEASSHGLEQRRLDGLRLSAVGFTNITRDHLDYHKSFEDYFEQKLRLFGTLAQPGVAAVVNTDADEGAHVAWLARRKGLRLMTVGRNGEFLRLGAAQRDGFAQRLEIVCQGRTYHVKLPLVGDFQASNALVAAGLAIGTGGAPDRVLPMLARLAGATGRLEHVGTAACGAPVFVDYAHTPDALTNALGALRPYVTGRLVVVFGCGGDRDKGKRPLMAKAAAEAADLVIVTDDNPRSEDPAVIRAETRAGAPDALDIGDRQTAITEAVRLLRAGDVLMIAGKGHESGQVVGGRVLPFTDHAAVAEALAEVTR